MGILSWIIVGLIAGALAKFIIPGGDPDGLLVTILIGIVGAVIGGFLVDLFVAGDLVSGINLTTILVATLGASTCWPSTAARCVPFGPGKVLVRYRVFLDGQHFQVNPRLVWVVIASRATIDGEDADPIGSLAEQTRLGNLWFRQRGIFFVGEAYLAPTLTSRPWHVRARANRATGIAANATSEPLGGAYRRVLSTQPSKP
jgi:uncharacterized membrane protein YeaQ/YmgE (transglycosylase-associated protein family)